MAAPAPAPKVVDVDDDIRPKVKVLYAKDGGIDMAEHGSVSLLRIEDTTPIGVRERIKKLAMRLDTTLGGVEVKWVDREQRSRRMLVPLSHIKVLELE